MRDIKDAYTDMMAAIPPETRQEGLLEFNISNRIVELMNKRNLSKSDLAEAIGVKPSVVTLWIGGMHNFTLKTIARLEVFFGEPILTVPLEFPPADVKNRSRRRPGKHI